MTAFDVCVYALSKPSDGVDSDVEYNGTFRPLQEVLDMRG
jgi:hypothetical protein